MTFFREGTEIGDGRYVLKRRIGAGGMATVWLANDSRLHRLVAIKIPSDALSHDPVFNQRFEREARTAASLSHPNLVSVHDYGWEGERPFLVSEYIDGASLDKLRQRGEAPSTEELATSILAALAAVHSSGIVHRDVKPGNVLVGLRRPHPAHRLRDRPAGRLDPADEDRQRRRHRPLPRPRGDARGARRPARRPLRLRRRPSRQPRR